MYDRLDMLATIETQLAISALLGWRTETAEIGNPGVLETLDPRLHGRRPDRGYGSSLTGGVAMELLETEVSPILGVHAVARLGASGYRRVFRGKSRRSK